MMSVFISMGTSIKDRIPHSFTTINGRVKPAAWSRIAISS